MMISNFQIWVLRYIFKRIFRQGPHHARNIAAVFTLVMETTRKEFTEDTGMSLYSFLRLLFDDAALSVLVDEMTLGEFSNLESFRI